MSCRSTSEDKRKSADPTFFPERDYANNFSIYLIAYLVSNKLLLGNQWGNNQQLWHLESEIGTSGAFLQTLPLRNPGYFIHSRGGLSHTEC
jgi:hypothetical protein